MEARIEQDGQSVDRMGDTIAHLIPGRRLHPAVRRQDPECRRRSAARDGTACAATAAPGSSRTASRREMSPGEEGDQDLISDHRSDDIADHDREPAPVGAELVRQDNPRHHTHGKGDREDLGAQLDWPKLRRSVGHGPFAVSSSSQSPWCVLVQLRSTLPAHGLERTFHVERPDVGVCR
jgi:hypothetical protein